MSTQTLQAWDTKIAPFLQIMEAKSNWVVQDINNLRHDIEVLASAVGKLPCRPDFETRAVASFVRAEAALVDALSRVRELKDEYAGKPSEHEFLQAAE